MKKMNDTLKQLALFLYGEVRVKWILMNDLILIEDCFLSFKTINAINEIRPILYVHHCNGYVVLLANMQAEYNKHLGASDDYTPLINGSLDKDFTVIRSNVVPDELVDDFNNNAKIIFKAKCV